MAFPSVSFAQIGQDGRAWDLFQAWMSSNDFATGKIRN